MTNALVIVAGQSRFASTKERLLQIFHKIFSTFSFTVETDYASPTPEPISSQKTSKFSNFDFKNRKLYFIPLALIVIIALVLVGKTLTDSNSDKLVAGASDSGSNFKKPIAAQTLNRTFSFPLKDENGKVLSQLKVDLTGVEEQGEIVIKGQKADAISGKVFLILNLKITNNYNKTIKINTRDYFRLTINNSNEKLAGNVHNDPVEVQAISTLYTRLGFTVNKSDKNLVLHVGEINGPKESVTLELK